MVKSKSKPKRTEYPSLLFYGSAIYDFLSPFKRAQNQWAARYIVVIFAIIIRSAIGFGSYSGHAIPPMFGDFEAQRHWLEITQHLPISQWYWYDLQYWGLDYPPLTAYHSWILGKLGSLINPEWFVLDLSRGLENQELKSFMRFTVILSEIIIFIPAVFRFTRWNGKHIKQSPIDQTIAASMILFQPSLMVIDHGHFQYNSVMLGFTLLSIVHLFYENYLFASIFFVCSLGFKQMSLYYSPIIFFYLLSRCFNHTDSNLPWIQRINFLRLILIGITTILSFVVLFGPLVLFGDFQNLLQSINRIFPFDRGIFEDKVANFWCFGNIFIKFRTFLTQQQLSLIALSLTTLSFLPACIIILLYPRKCLLPWSLSACSLGFFLFSFQVHEKSILVPLLPITLLYSTKNTDEIAMVSWINNIALFSLWPLLKKDGLMIQYGALFLLSNWLFGNLSFITPRFLPNFLTPGPSISVIDGDLKKRHGLPSSLLWRLIILLSYTGIAVIHFVDLFVKPPSQYPDLWVLANVSLSFGCFGLFWLWIYYKLIVLRDVAH
ncbi:alpha-1,3-glucosyltransferase [Wickerhamomyces ciferrii]|uniref:Alpha-1,3-glucosyltransferase n=1 Tax=Wickerhamomyces ciferrii (strain ATCC 14091 / BCRC 22168 / CBS 111 / JCM 3599 / NBRC 0793 / NRRL Y-1031 F-60-10) TaxID=1206466 RepID=K0KKM0_WICCF|nr:alpha-1,3-glucosyltransferase [Wickerhamomyces ciferrii]CCH42702.1 alpha-1,3-glucosyltransferase [Wickerhamomyces ciferrii]